MGPADDPQDAPAAQAPDRRTRPERRQGERRAADQPVAVERRKGGERRARQRRERRMNQYDMDAETLDFIRAIGRFKDRTGRPFPTWSEVLGILKELGYERRD